MKLKLRQVRESKGWSINKLAGKSGVAQGYISELEEGKKNPSAQTLCKLANALGCSVSDIVDCE